MKLAEDSKISLKISRNRNAYFLKNDIKPAKVVSAEIAHRNQVAIVSQKNSGKIILGADGLITQSKDIYLSITSADCLPIFLFDPKKEIIGIIHAGWRSLANDIVKNTIFKLANSFNSDLKYILVGIGPAICQKHYEVGLEVTEKFKKYPEAIKREDEKIYLDLKKIAELQFISTGIQEKNIEISSECTFELSEKYFSARRDLSLTNCPINSNIQSKGNDKLCNQQLVRGKKKEIEAMIAVIGLKE